MRRVWMPSRFAAVLLGALVLALLPPLVARADDAPKPEQLPRRQASFTWQKTQTGGSLLMASFSFKDVVDAEIRTKLESGLTNVIAMRAYVLREGEESPVALAVRTCSVAFDLWDQVYRLKISGPGGPRDTAALNLDGVLRQCAEVRDLPMADRTLFAPATGHFIGVIVEVNPVTSTMLDQMRKWVSRPAGSTGIGPGDALFGSFVGLFVRQIGTADRTLRFRSQIFTP